MQLLPKQKNHLPAGGQIYLDVLITIAILIILSHALFSLIISTYELISFNRARITGRHLAQEKIELIRNLPYNNVGTTGGIPAGPLPQNENIVRNSLNYKVKVDVVYIDDPFDQQAPLDLLPTDYKRVRVDVSWGGLAASATNPVTMITDIAPKGIETTVGGGTLSILVFDAHGQPVPQAEVKIIASTINPPVDLNLKTADDGRIMLPGAKICNACFEITITKAGYSSDKTYTTTEIANPNKPHVSILENQVTEISFAIDKLSTLIVYSVQDRQHNFIPWANQSFILKGEKILGTDINDDPVFKFEKNYATDGAGQTTIPDLEWDNYHLTLPDGSPVDFAGSNPLLPIIVLPGLSYNFSFILTSHTDNSLLTIFKDASKNPLASVSAILFNDIGFQASGSSGLSAYPDFGQIFFKNLLNQSYHLTATAAGFLDYNGNVNISGQTKEEINMTAQ